VYRETASKLGNKAQPSRCVNIRFWRYNVELVDDFEIPRDLRRFRDNSHSRWEPEMALKDTLQKLQQQPSFIRDDVVDEWQKAANDFLARVREFLGEYTDTIQFSPGTTQLDEESLRPPYTISNMALRAGPAVILIQPIGRMIVGATGRVDLYRQGRAAESQRVIALRKGVPPEHGRWSLSIPPQDRSFELMSTAALREASQRAELQFSKENLESALERLLQQ
jgi:hypothetical protein